MTLTKKLEENKLTIIGTAALLLTLWAGYQSGIFSSQESMEQFLAKQEPWLLCASFSFRPCR